jgi:F-type H+-transporting ATPase subunit a
VSAGAEGGHSPLAQFEIHRFVDLKIGGIDASITNSSVIMVAIVVLVTIFLVGGMRKRAMVPGRWQSMAELSYEFIADMLQDNVGPGARRFFPFVFTLFMFILSANLLGLAPLGHYSFTVTSHIIVTFALAAVVLTGVTITGFVVSGTKFLRLFMPSGVPVALLPFLIVIEILSYLVRPFSLSIRLFANMMAGHTMLKVFAGFVISLGIIGGWAPFAFIIALTGLELGIAVLQAYVFTILTCIYLNDAFHPGH